MKASNRIGDSKASGLDGVPNVAFKTAISCRSELFLEVYNLCLREGVFSRQWKQQRLLFIPKGNNPPNDSSSYRPICLLDTVGKVLERDLCNRLKTYSEDTERGLSDNQFGFRIARSTVDAIDRLIDVARKAIEGKRWKGGAKQYCAMVTFDVKNAFNSAQWGRILITLSSMEVSAYMKRIIASYFSNRTLTYYTDTGRENC